jgi:hypothetical protein
LADPLWRAYVFTYHVGYDLLGAWIDRDDESSQSDGTGNQRQARFVRLLEEQMTPSAIRSELG